MSTGTAVAVVVGLSTVVGCPGQTIGTPDSVPKELAIEGTYIHEPTGKQFPGQVAGFRREKVLQYDTYGRLVSIGYNLEEPAQLIAATVYLSPLPSLPFAEELNAVQRAHAHFALAFDQETILERGGRTLPCRLAGFSYEERFAHRYGPVTSYLLICDSQSWRAKWRFTHLPTSDRGITRVMKTLASTLTVPQ